MNFSRFHMLGAFACLASGTAALAAYAQQQEKPQDNDGALVVTGKRDERRLQGGEWNISLSRAYRSGHLGDTSPVGRDRAWKFCLGDADVEPLMRILVGEGRTASSATTTCSPLVLQLGDGRLRGSQSCRGGSMQPVEVETHQGVGSLASRSGGGGGGGSPSSATVPAKSSLTVTGRYGRDKLVIDFHDVQEPVSPEMSYLTRPDVLRWSIKGERVGDCQLEPVPGK